VTRYAKHLTCAWKLASLPRDLALKVNQTGTQNRWAKKRSPFIVIWKRFCFILSTDTIDSVMRPRSSSRGALQVPQLQLQLQKYDKSRTPLYSPHFVTSRGAGWPDKPRSTHLLAIDFVTNVPRRRLFSSTWVAALSRRRRRRRRRRAGLRAGSHEDWHTQTYTAPAAWVRLGRSTNVWVMMINHSCCPACVCTYTHRRAGRVVYCLTTGTATTTDTARAYVADRQTDGRTDECNTIRSVRRQSSIYHELIALWSHSAVKLYHNTDDLSSTLHKAFSPTTAQQWRLSMKSSELFVRDTISHHWYMSSHLQFL